MPSNGEYRSLYTALADDDDFILTSPMAKSVFYTLKLKLPSVGIGNISIVSLASLVNASRMEVESALTELGVKWVRREKSVVWIVNGLRFHPNLSSRDRKHRAHVIALVNALPCTSLVDSFRSYYADWFDAPAEPQSSPVEGPAKALRSTANEEENENVHCAKLAAASGVTAALGDPRGYRWALITALNQGMRANPDIGDAFSPIPHEHSRSFSAAADLYSAGVDCEFAKRAVFEKAATYAPTPRSRQISSLAFCTDYVLEQWQRAQARMAMAASPVPINTGSYHRPRQARARTLRHNPAQQAYENALAALEVL